MAVYQFRSPSGTTNAKFAINTLVELESGVRLFVVKLMLGYGERVNYALAAEKVTKSNQLYITIIYTSCPESGLKEVK